MSASGDVVALTHDYEAWLGQRIGLVPAGLTEKHRVIASGELPFLRGTYYLWLVRVAELLPEVAQAPVVSLVGDLHIENFGTWRDSDQVRRWGVNDLDELARGSWRADLLRLATSVALAPHVSLGDHDVCDELLSAYAVAEPGPAVDLIGSGAAHLADLVRPHDDPAGFYEHLARGRTTQVPAEVAVAAAEVAEPGWRPTWHEHDAGTGSLGHRRAVGIGPADDGTPHAREAKQLGPGTAVWAAARVPHCPEPADLYRAVVAAVSGPGGATRIDGWQVRDLAPDVLRIELDGLKHHDVRRVLRSMARSTADVHAAAGDDEARRAREHAARWSPADLAGLVTTMKDVTRADLAVWRKALGNH